MSKTVFLGVEGSGKTTLTMALVKAFERHRKEGWYLKPLSRNSFKFLQTVPAVFDGTNFPSQTARLRELSWEIEYNNQTLTDFCVLDYPGEIYRLAFLDEKDEDDPQTFRQLVEANKSEINSLLNSVKEAESVYVLFNLSDADNIHDNSRNLDAIWLTNECLNLMKKTGMISKVQLLLTQADRYRDAGMNLSEFSLDNIPLIGHDNIDVPWHFISVVEEEISNCGIDELIEQLISKPLTNMFSENAIDFDAIDVGQLIDLNYLTYTVSINRKYLDSILNALGSYQVTDRWIISKITGKRVTRDMILDMINLKKVLLNIDGVALKYINFNVPKAKMPDIWAIKTDWGLNLGEKIARRIMILQSVL